MEKVFMLVQMELVTQKVGRGCNKEEHPKRQKEDYFVSEIGLMGLNCPEKLLFNTSV